ncbi:hypothetical protein AND4_15875 [Vibrio sp. AND4]|nr:hypothetical protein AND4_15875 [Vibrio sp. AND4]
MTVMSIGMDMLSIKPFGIKQAQATQHKVSKYQLMNIRHDVSRIFTR